MACVCRVVCRVFNPVLFLFFYLTTCIIALGNVINSKLLNEK